MFRLFGFINDRGGRNTSGIGLGLMISHKLVREFGGQFHVNSIPNQGSIFKFTIQLNNIMNEDYDESIDNKLSQKQDVI